MNEKEILRKINVVVSDLFKNDTTGHDLFHIQRVVTNARTIAKTIECNAFYTELLAYLHDVGDYKLHKGKDRTRELVTNILLELNYPSQEIEEIVRDIQQIGFKGGFNTKPSKIEVQIVQDADRLDALGAVGIARAFAYGGSKGRLIYDPEYDSKKIESEEEYKKAESPTIQHFYDKLFKLKDLMNTAKGKELAEERHKFMEQFVRQFYKEWGDS